MFKRMRVWLDSLRARRASRISAGVEVAGDQQRGTDFTEVGRDDSFPDWGGDNFGGQAAPERTDRLARWSEPGLPDLWRGQLPEWTTEQLRFDLRDANCVGQAVLRFEPSVNPGQFGGLVDEGWRQYPTFMGNWLLATLQHVHHVGRIGREVVVPIPAADGVHPCLPILTRFPCVEVVSWTESPPGCEPTIKAKYRFGPHPMDRHGTVPFGFGTGPVAGSGPESIATRVTVAFSIGYYLGPDGTRNIEYVVDEIHADGTRHPTGR